MFDFGENLKKLRLNKKMSQKALATRVNVSESMICRYEKGEIYPPFETLCSLSNILGVSLDEFCGMQRNETVSTHNLSKEQNEIVVKLVTAFRNKNSAIKKNLSSEQYELLGQIIAEFTK